MNSAVKTWLAAYAISAVVFALIDAVWIATVAGGLYAGQLGHLLGNGFNLPAAAVFYLGYVAGLVHFGVQPLNATATLVQRVVAAALYGLFTYGTWALTALAVLKDFPVLVSVTDIAWGVGVCALVTAITATIWRRAFTAAPATPAG